MAETEIMETEITNYKTICHRECVYDLPFYSAKSSPILVLRCRCSEDYHRGAMRIAPSSRITSPCGIRVAIIAPTSCAYSSSLPRRLGCGAWAPSECWTSRGKLISIAVRKRPGAIVITRILCCARSRATGNGYKPVLFLKLADHVRNDVDHVRARETERSKALVAFKPATLSVKIAIHRSAGRHNIT